MNIYRLSARILSVILLLLIGTIMIAHLLDDGIPADYVFTVTERMLFGFLFTGLLGMIIAWRREMLGGTLTIIGSSLFMLINFLDTGVFNFNPVFAAILLAGILFVLSARQGE
jgi:hypothetical protein